MSRTALLSASVGLALVAACIAALVIISMRPAEATFPGRNGAIAFTDHFEVHRVQPDGTRATPLADQIGYSQNPTFSADGKKIAFQNDIDDIDDIPRDLWVMGADGENQTNITNTPNVDEWHPSWFPSGRKIAYSGAYSRNFRNFNIEVATLDESGKVAKTTRLTSSEDYPLGFPDPSVSPDGKKLAFSSVRDGDEEIYMLRTDAPAGPNNKPLQLTTNATYRDRGPNWSPDGKKLVYASCRAWPECDIFVMRADGTGKKNLTRNLDAGEVDPAFSPDGRFVVFAGEGGVWKMRADGTGVTFVTRDGDHPDWQPLP
jgi:Tol biopolymer transport system component